jgi:hypothetical protein
MGLWCDVFSPSDATAIVFTGVGYSYSGDPLLPYSADQLWMLTPGGDPLTCKVDNVVAPPQPPPPPANINTGEAATACTDRDTVPDAMLLQLESQAPGYACKWPSHPC